MNFSGLTIVFAAAFLLLLTPVALAQDFSFVDVNVKPSSTLTMPTKTTILTMEIKNNQNKDDVFNILYSGDYLFWKYPGELTLDMKAGESKELKLVFFPQEAREVTYAVKVESRSSPSVFDTALFTLVVTPGGVLIRSVSASKSGNDVVFKADIESIREGDTEVDFAVKDSSGDVKAILKATERVIGKATVIRSAPQTDFAPGLYTLEASSHGVSKSETFIVDEVRNIQRTEERTGDSFGETVTITLTNTGNVPEVDYQLTQTQPFDSVTGFVTHQAETCYQGAEGIRCDYKIDEISPGETVVVKYDVNYWPGYAKWLAGIIIVAVIGLFSFSQQSKPRLQKRYTGSDGKTHGVALEIRSRRHGMKGVVVRDLVHPLGEVIESSFTSLKPVVKKSEETTELIWNIGDMQKGEHRILHYRVKPVLKASIKLPRSELTFTTDKGERRKLFSGESEFAS